MNQGQEQFFNFILERVMEEKEEDAKALLAEGFDRQAEGSFGMEYLQNYILRMAAMLKPECVEEVTGIMKNFGKDHVQ